MQPDDDVVHYHITFNPNDLSVRLDVSGFETVEDARAFADWLSTLPFDDEEIGVTWH